MTSPATQAPCPACGYNGAGFYQSATHPCAESFHRTGRWEKPAPPSQRAELLTRELESAMAKLRANTGEFKPRLLRAEAAALLARLEALEQRVEAAEAAISNMGAALTDCGNYEAVLEQAAKDAIDELASAHGEYAELAAGNARRILDAALSQEPRNG